MGAFESCGGGRHFPEPIKYCLIEPRMFTEIDHFGYDWVNRSSGTPGLRDCKGLDRR